MQHYKLAKHAKNPEPEELIRYYNDPHLTLQLISFFINL